MTTVITECVLRELPIRLLIATGVAVSAGNCVCRKKCYAAPFFSYYPYTALAIPPVGDISGGWGRGSHVQRGTLVFGEKRLHRFLNRVPRNIPDTVQVLNRSANWGVPVSWRIVSP